MLNVELQCTITVPKKGELPVPPGNELPVKAVRRKRVTGVHFTLRLGQKAHSGKIDFDVHLVYE